MDSQVVREIGFKIVETQIAVSESWFVIALCDRGKYLTPLNPSDFIFKTATLSTSWSYYEDSVR